MGSFRYGLTFHFIGPSVKDQQRNRLTVQYVPQTRKSLVKGERFIRCVWKTWLVVNITWIAIQTVFTGIWNWPWGLTGEEKHCLYLLACAMHAQSHHEHTSSICWLDVHCLEVVGAFFDLMHTYVWFGVSGAFFGTCIKPYLTVGGVDWYTPLSEVKQANVAWSV